MSAEEYALDKLKYYARHQRLARSGYIVTELPL